MAGRTGMWAIGGALAAAGALVSSPGTYHRLRRLARLESDRRFFSDREAESELEHDVADAAPMDTRAARLSLRARLSDAGDISDPTVRPTVREDHDTARRAVSEARGRMVAKARAAADEARPASEPE
jgi:hypothetical protein